MASSVYELQHSWEASELSEALHDLWSSLSIVRVICVEDVSQVGQSRSE